MTQFPHLFKLPLFRGLFLWLVLFFLCFLIQFFQLADYFAFNRTLIEQWQLWRLLSGHLTHLSWNHFLLNMAGLFMVAFFFAGYQSRGYWIGALLFIALVCSAGLMLDNQLQRYVGFSGVLHGLFIIGGRWELKKHTTSGAVLLVLIVGKLIWEQLYGALPGSETMAGGRVAVNAHLYGAIAGAVYCFRLTTRDS
ncbi:Integral membrane protein [hydrothermal vent metagenome]|uniref:Integral membrane protein n=1 Tax=hydrothermal vent metagenome TaxID=652676 RepID=A0A3B0Y243_9ZZZZ